MITFGLDEPWVCDACHEQRSGDPKVAFAAGDGEWVLFCDCVSVEWERDFVEVVVSEGYAESN